MNTNIKAVILDVDGVITGSKVGVNSPMPSKKVLEKLFNLNKSGVKVLLNTGKPGFGIKRIVTELELNEFHSSDGGGLVYNWIKDELGEANFIESDTVVEIIESLRANDFLYEIYTKDNYYADNTTNSTVTKRHSEVVFQQALLVDDIINVAKKNEIIKIIALGRDESEIQPISKLIKKTSPTNVTLSWGVHPSTFPIQYGVITKIGKSKESGARFILNNLGIPFKNVLGVGDSMHDWQFIEHCGFKATLENASDKMKNTIENNGGFISKSVDEDGILEIFEKFEL